ncbi:MAG TPA: chemotaxis protein CheA [Candidatus Acidoferrales bacterium]|nr:chemotaxis protein CheA [Candidatus Acidoferrales bacterium]
MIDLSRLLKLTGHLQAEIIAARAGDTQGQFPILDLVGNLRDEAGAAPELSGLAAACAEAWERIVRIVESGQPFTADDIAWLKELLARVQALAGLAGSSTAGAAPAPAALPPPPPPALCHGPEPETAAGDPAIPTEEAPLSLNLAEDADLLREFITESREHLDNIEQGVLILENSPTDAEVLNTIFRAFHTFKGGAGFLNLLPINRLAHVLESLLDLGRQGKLAIDAPVIELILRGRDVLKQFLDEIEGQLSGTRPQTPITIPTALLKAEVQEMMERRADTGAAMPVPEAAPAPEAVSSQAMAAPAEPAPVQAQTAATAPAEAAIPAIPAAPAAATPPAEPASSGNAAVDAAAEAARMNAPAAPAAMVKVDTGKLDGLLDLVGEMVIAQSLVGQNVNDLAGLNPQAMRNLAQLGRITKELQRVSMALRMVPVRGVFQKMSRVVRDIAIKQQKKVNFTTSGEDTELDRTVVEELNDPLLHMIRNSMDHGIEPPEKRMAAGKPAAGNLTLRAYHQGGNIVVEIEDDGAGLNRERILAKAIERGLARNGEPLTDEQIFHFIFAAGFSTAEKITDLSGRGVGLDVVRRNIERLRGRVEISSQAGRGTRFKISLPLTLAIIDGFIVKVGEERYILPTLSVRESFRPQPGMVSRVQNKAEVVNVRGRIIPLLRLNEVFGVSSSSREVTDGIVVVVEAGADLRCLLVDGLLHKQEVVIKNLNDMMVHKNKMLAGAAILGDGLVGLILDVNALVHLQVQPQQTRTA